MRAIGLASVANWTRWEIVSARPVCDGGEPDGAHCLQALQGEIFECGFGGVHSDQVGGPWEGWEKWEEWTQARVHRAGIARSFGGGNSGQSQRAPTRP